MLQAQLEQHRSSLAQLVLLVDQPELAAALDRQVLQASAVSLVQRVKLVRRARLH